MAPKRNRKKRIHINQHVIRKNTKEGTADPPITIKCGRENHYCAEAEIQGHSRLVYSPYKPLMGCGARLVLETSAAVVMDNKKVIE
jgi:hypothetical protein